MQSLFAILLIIGFLGIIVGAIMLIASLIRKKNKKKSLIIMGASFVVMVLGVIGVDMNAPKETATSSNSKIEATSETKKNSSNSTKSSTEESSSTKKSSSTTESSSTKESSSTTESSSTKESSSTTESSSSNDLTSVNTQITAYLEQNKGFANGTLDENGNPTENGTPNPVFNWALTVSEISYEENLIKVNVNDNFLTLSQTDASSAALYAQNAAVSIISENEGWDMDKAADGVFTQVYYNGKVIGRSKMTNVKEFKWKEF
ncbi:hypothetical protein P7G96_08955 [Enterococcus thailandicus]|uniref:hypothetical protein n=1 Tax=Enterococcus thailandicus TaxID=417368 RepID=UPI00288EB312|nr:hypothetical protein [Enterococcus thailandicus]MDT2776621.1 hypothetical protein [Enterococcus thailandicus]